MNTSASADILITGGGLAGAAAAVVLARAKRRVILLERDPEPRHKVCGEFLSAEAVHMLQALGISPSALGAVPVHHVRLCSSRHVTTTTLPFAALSLTRRRLDAALLDAAASAGVEIQRGAAVQKLAHNGGAWHGTLRDGRTVCAPRALLATGKHDLHGHMRPAGPQGDLLALKMYFTLAPAQTAALDRHVELLLYPGGYAGLQPVEDHAANLCALIRRSVFAQIGGDWHALLAHIRQSCPHGHQRLASSHPLLEKPIAISAIPYGFVRTHAAGEQLWAVGDQAAVIPSFTGDGMSIALYTGLRAAQSILRGESAESFQHCLHEILRPQVARSSALSRALLFGPARHTLVQTARMWPAALRWMAAATRLPMHVVHSLQLETEPPADGRSKRMLCA